MHAKFWIKDAPVIGKSTSEEIRTFLADKLCCTLPKQGTKLYDLVNSFQLHRCTKSCLKRKRLRNTFVSYCRFDFPRRIAREMSLTTTDKTIPKRRYGRREKVYQLPRTEHEQYINDYNAAVRTD